MTDIRYRPLEDGDFPGIYHVALEAWRFTYRDMYDREYIEAFVKKNYTRERLAGLMHQVRSGANSFDVALSDGKIVGYCHIGLPSRGAQMYSLYVLPTFIGRGVGWGLLQRGEAFVKSHGHRMYHCFVHRDNELAKRFYLRQGFQHVVALDEPEDWYLEKALVAKLLHESNT